LIEAVTVGLYGNMLSRSHDPDVGKSLMFFGVAGGFMGGMIFSSLNEAMRNQSVWSRRWTALRKQGSKLRFLFVRRLARKMGADPVLRGMGEGVVLEIAKG
jgi:hypothetical protein